MVKKSVDHSDSTTESPEASMYKEGSEQELNQFVDAPSSLPKVKHINIYTCMSCSLRASQICVNFKNLWLKSLKWFSVI